MLEIGCGTGLLLWRIAPQCAAYVGTDLSETVVRNLRGHLQDPGHHLPHVTVRHQAADDFSGIEPGSFDVVVLNSVIQYFPGLDT